MNKKEIKVFLIGDSEWVAAKSVEEAHTFLLKFFDYTIEDIPLDDCTELSSEEMKKFKILEEDDIEKFGVKAASIQASTFETELKERLASQSIPPFILCSSE